MCLGGSKSSGGGSQQTTPPPKPRRDPVDPGVTPDSFRDPIFAQRFMAGVFTGARGDQSKANVGRVTPNGAKAALNPMAPPPPPPPPAPPPAPAPAPIFNIDQILATLKKSGFPGNPFPYGIPGLPGF